MSEALKITPNKVIFFFVIVLASFLLLPHDNITVFGYNVGRQAQTYAPYDCFLHAKFRASIGCFFFQPTGADNNRYFPLDAPIMQLLQADFFPYNPPDSLISVFPFLGVAVVLWILASIRYFTVERSFNLLLGIAVTLAYIKAPTVRYFATAFQQNMFALALFMAGSVVATHSKWRKAGLVVAGIGVVDYPQLAIIASSLILWLQFIDYEKSDKSSKLPISIKTAVKESLLLYAPIFAYFVIGHIGIHLGLASKFPHNLSFVTFDQIMNGDFRRTFVDNVGFCGVGLMLLLAALVSASVYELGSGKQWFKMAIVIYPLLTAFLTFLALFQLFFTNVTYGYIFMAGLMFAYVVAGSLTYPVNARRIPEKVLLAASLICVLVPPTLIRTSSHSWSGPYIYVQLMDMPKVCQPEAAHSLVASMPPDAPLYMDFSDFDPTGRTAVSYRGVNKPHGSITDADIEKFKTTSSYYMGCKQYGEQITGDNKKRIIDSAQEIKTAGDWFLLKYGHSR